ncbi:hypothetical protein CY35_06G120500 [Sphagnum magellanicum]|nr:hypothetical protein CY35_06G120500 [Sphagnum magellanicum]
MLLKLCFHAHCLVARFPGCPTLRGWKSYSGSSSAISFNLFRHNLVNCNSKCRVRFFLRRFLQHLVCKNRGTNRSMAPPGHFR